MDMFRFLCGFKPGTSTGALLWKVGKVDLGILKVAFMVAAIDGDVTEEEYRLFARLAAKCRGCDKAMADAALDEAMRTAGYLYLKAKMLGETALARAFVSEAEKALPDGFSCLAIEDIRRAVVTWIMMAIGDGEYSSRERTCVEALRRRFAEIKVERNRKAEERARLLSPAFRQVVGGSKTELVSKRFADRVEDLASRLGDSEAAAEALRNLIEKGE